MFLNPNFKSYLGLYKSSLAGEWYLMFRRKEGWRKAERRLLKRNMELIATWENVPQTIDIGNLIINHYRQFVWFARGNLLQTDDTSINSDHVKQIITFFINRENEAHMLAKDNDVYIS